MNNTWTETNQNKVWKSILALVLIALATVFAVRQGTNRLQELIQKNGKLSVVISLIAYALLGATPIPSEPLTIFITTLYGPLIAILVATAGNTLAAWVEFFIGGRINDLSDFEKRKAKLPFHLDKLPIDSPVFLLLGRMLPGFGPKFVSVVSGVYQVSFWTYTWTAVISNSVGAVMVSMGGYGLIKLL